MVDLLAQPGQIMAPDGRLAAPPAVIASPLQFERPIPFAGSSVSVHNWARSGLGPREGNSVSGPQSVPNVELAISLVPPPKPILTVPIRVASADLDKGTSISSPRAQNMGPYRGGIPSPRGGIAAQPFDFSPLEDSQRLGVVQIAKERELEKENSSHNSAWDREKLRGGNNRYDEYQGSKASQNQDMLRGQRNSGDVNSGGQSDNEAGGRGGGTGTGTGSRASDSQEDEINRYSRGKLVENAVAFAKEFEIPWEDLVIGERIGQGWSSETLFPFIDPRRLITAQHCHV